MRPNLAISTLLVLLLTPAAASAASIVAWDVPTMTAHSSMVVEATVESVSTEVLENGNFQTRNSIRVDRYLAGAGPDRLDVLQAGGTVGEHEVLVVGDIRLRPGQRAVLFLRGTGPELHATLLGWSAFTIDGSGDDAAVSRDAAGLATFVQEFDGTLTPIDPDSVPAPTTLGQLRAQVREVAR